MSSGWSWWVILLTLSNIVACFALLWWARSRRVAGAAQATLGHEYDGRRYWITEAQIEAYRRKCQRRAAA